MKSDSCNIFIFAAILASFAAACHCSKPVELGQDADGNLDGSGSSTGRSVTLNVNEIPQMTVGGEPYVLTATFTGEGTESLPFEWTSSDPQVAAVVPGNTVSTATVSAVSEGNAVITISSSVTILPRKVEDDGILKVLAIGNSFSQDAVEQYLWELFDETGCETVIGNMYIGGCSLDTHWSNAQSDKAAYEYRKMTGSKTSFSGAKLSEIIASENWDYISLQQVSGKSGQYDTFTHLPDLIDYVQSHATNPDMKILYHQTWAYQTGSDHGEFGLYGKDQMKMYQAIMDAVQRAVKDNGEIELVVPSGTAVQNGRTSIIGDTFCRDGYHLEVNYGRFTAACVWYQTISRDLNIDKDITECEWKPESVSEFYADIAKQAAKFAVAKPYEVTEMTEWQTPDITSDGKTPMYVDFGGQTPSSAPWNNFTAPGVSAKAVYLMDEAGNYSPVTLSVTTAFSGTFSGPGSEPDRIMTDQEKIVTFPKTAWKDGFMVSGPKGQGNVGPAVLKISGLSADMKYSLYIVSSRFNGSVDARKTEFIVKGASESEPRFINQGWKAEDLSTDEMYKRIASFKNISPDKDGNIFVRVKGIDTGNAAEGHINAMAIEPAKS